MSSSEEIRITREEKRHRCLFVSGLLRDHQKHSQPSCMTMNYCKYAADGRITPSELREQPFLRISGFGRRRSEKDIGAEIAKNPQFSTFPQCLEYLELSDGPDTPPGWSTHEYYRLREFQSVRTEKSPKF